MPSRTPPAHNVHSLHSFPQQPNHIKPYFQKQHLPILLSLIYQFQEQPTGNTCKVDSLTSFHFLLKTLLCFTDLRNLDNSLATALRQPHQQCLTFPICLSVCAICPWLHSQILTPWRKEHYSFCIFSTAHCTMKSWTFIWVSKCHGNVPQQSLTLGLDSAFHKASTTASRS